MDFYPTSENEFAKWTTEDGTNQIFRNCRSTRQLIGPFTSHGRDTLKRASAPHEQLRAEANQLFTAMKKMARKQLTEDEPDYQIQKLKAEKDHLQAMVESEGATLLHVYAQNAELQREVATLKRAIASAKEEYQTVLGAKETLIMELTRQLAQVGRFSRLEKVPE